MIWFWTAVGFGLSKPAGACGVENLEEEQSFIQQPPMPIPGNFEGWAELVETDFLVQSKVSVQVRYTVGPSGMQSGDFVRIEEPIFHGIRWAKWGFLVADPALCTPLSDEQLVPSVGSYDAETSGAATLELFHSLDDDQIHGYGTLDVQVMDGELVEGDVIEVRMGLEEGECGWQTAHRAFDQIEMRVFEHFDGAERGVLLEPTLRLNFVAESEVYEWEAVLPSDGVVGEPVVLRLAPLDRHGNLADGRRIVTEERIFENAGIHRVSKLVDGVQVRSNPILIHSSSPEERVFWGDIHVHHGHSYEDEDGNWVDLNHEYGRDVRAMDFGAETVKGMYLELGTDDLWERVKRSCETYTVDEEYVAIRAFEWMGGPDVGHNNVYFEGCEAPLPDEELPGVDQGLWPYMETAMAELGVQAVSIPHATPFTGHDWKVRDDDLRPVAEIYSAWGNSLDETLLGNVAIGLRHGQRMGFIGASDNHEGFIGNDLQGKNVLGGLGAIQATELSSRALIEAMQRRSTYATTGDRILVRFQVEDGSAIYGAGDEWVRSGEEQAPPRLIAEVNGTDAVRSVRLMHTGVGFFGESAIQQNWEFLGSCLDCFLEADLNLFPEETNIFWLHIVQEDGEEAWASPIWIQAAGLKDGEEGKDEASLGCACTSSTSRPERRLLAWAVLVAGVVLVRRRGYSSR